jgi:hypothetical protein
MRQDHEAGGGITTETEQVKICARITKRGVKIESTIYFILCILSSLYIILGGERARGGGGIDGLGIS